MAEQVFPTKGNLIKAKRSLQQAKQGFELMDRKRNVLIREMVALTDKSKLVRGNSRPMKRLMPPYRRLTLRLARYQR